MACSFTAAHSLGAHLKARAETIAVAESSSAGLISASLLAVPGASAYFHGGAIIYTLQARRELLGIDDATLRAQIPLSEAYVSLCAERIRTRLGATWGVAELGATGPAPTPYGHAPGVCVLAVVGPVTLTERVTTGSPDREANMQVFAQAALALLEQALQRMDGRTRG
jgi:PncC family amidohydrolase